MEWTVTVFTNLGNTFVCKVGVNYVKLIDLDHIPEQISGICSAINLFIFGFISKFYAIFNIENSSITHNYDSFYNFCWLWRLLLISAVTPYFLRIIAAVWWCGGNVVRDCQWLPAWCLWRTSRICSSIASVSQNSNNPRPWQQHGHYCHTLPLLLSSWLPVVVSGKPGHHTHTLAMMVGCATSTVTNKLQNTLLA